MYREDRFYRNKEPLKYTMPYAKIVHDNPVIVLNKDASMQTTWNYRGPDLDSAVPEQLAIITQQLNQSFLSLDSGWVLFFEAQRITSNSYARDTYFPDPVTQAMDDERRLFFSNGNHFESNYYLTAYWIPPNDNAEVMKEFIVEGREHKEITASDNIERFCEKIEKLFNIFKNLRIPVHYLSKDEMVTYLHSTISANPRPIVLPEKPLLLDQFLYDSPFYGGIEPRLGNKHIRIIVPIKYASGTIFGHFNKLNQLNFPYRWITRFFCLSKRDAISELEGIKNGWNGKIKSLRSMAKELIFNQESDNNINENAQAKFNEVKDAINATESEITSYGYYSTAVIVMDDDIDAVESKAKLVEQVFINLGFSAQIENLNAIDAWMGCIPGNIGHNIRRPLISCGNLVHMMPISDIWAGPERNKHLGGPPLIYTETTGNTPFRLSLHIGDVGHTFLVGPTGAGKSVHLNMIAASFRKYKNAKVFIFDNGAASMPLTMAVGGKFFNLGSEDKNLSFQPLAEIDQEKEKQWAFEWLCDYISHENLKITPALKKVLLDALTTVASYPKKMRTISTLIDNCQDQSLKDSLLQLSIKGAYGSIFDSDTDSLSFSSWQTFEMKKLMETPSIVGPTLMYIFHRIEKTLANVADGGPTIINLDECWRFFDDSQFVKKIREWLKVLRKSNASVVFATQNIIDIVDSPIFSTVLESCQSQIFLPYDKALEKGVIEKYFMFGLNKKQVDIIANAVRKKQYYYVSPAGSRLYDLTLEYCPISLAYVAVDNTDVEICKNIIAEHGQENFNKYWLEYKNINLSTINTEGK